MGTNSFSAPQDVICNLCGASDERVVYQSKMGSSLASQHFLVTTDVYGACGRIVCCHRCRLVYQNPRPKADDMIASYVGMENEEYLREMDCRSINAHLSVMTIRQHIKKGRLLDVGCSTGFILNAARPSFQVEGVEPSLWSARQAQNMFNLKVQQGSIEDSNFKDNSFDVVSMVDVIEHLTDPKSALKKVNQILRPNGLFYIVTPDFRSLSSCLMGRYWWGLRPSHLYYFSRKTLSRLLKQTGFRPVTIKSYGRLFTLDYWLSRLKNYPSFVRFFAGGLIRCFKVGDKVVYINTRDSMELCAIKEEAPLLKSS